MQRELSSASAVDTARVQSIREALQAGTYKVNAEAIADRMLDLESKLGA
jgi:negative regulator of flagellin synthesis FlgM